MVINFDRRDEGRGRTARPVMNRYKKPDADLLFDI